MPVTDPDDLDRIDQEIRINELKARAEELGGGKMSAWENDDLPPGIAEQFWSRVVDVESAPDTTHWEQLERYGGLPKPASELDDQSLPDALWKLVNRLAGMRVFLYQTNHLSDRALYTLLTEELLHEWTPDMPTDIDSSCVLDILGGCSEEDIENQHRYYANEEERQHWMEQFPDYAMPAHVDPPFDRDRLLPKSEDAREGL